MIEMSGRQARYGRMLMRGMLYQISKLQVRLALEPHADSKAINREIAALSKCLRRFPPEMRPVAVLRRKEEAPTVSGRRARRNQADASRAPAQEL